jgi:hypothetical protein
LTTYYVFDEAGHEVSATTPVDASGALATTTNYYDANANVVAITKPGALRQPATRWSAQPAPTRSTRATTRPDGCSPRPTTTRRRASPTATTTTARSPPWSTAPETTTLLRLELDDEPQSPMELVRPFPGPTTARDACSVRSYPNPSANTCASSGAGHQFATERDHHLHLRFVGSTEFSYHLDGRQLQRRLQLRRVHWPGSRRPRRPRWPVRPRRTACRRSHQFVSHHHAVQPRLGGTN